MTALHQSSFSPLSFSGKHWHESPSDFRLSQTLRQRFGLSDVVASILSSRLENPLEAENFLTPTLKTSMPDPYHLKDMDKAVDRFIKALENKELIGLLGDYDVDGATSTSLLYMYLKGLGGHVCYHIPDRVKEGYGPSHDAMQSFAKKGVRLVVTLDCGTTSFEALEAAGNLGMETIVLDHHMAEAKTPKVHALVNPNRLDETSSCGYLAAVGVTFLLVVALQADLRAKGFFHGKKEPDLLSYLDLVALGTVCDVMPLKGLNRAFVAQGLKVMARRHRLGLRLLADVAGLDETPTPYHLGFLLGPRINAGGRIGTSTLGTQLLTTQDPQQAQNLANQLNELNQERQAMEKECLDQAMEQAETLVQKGYGALVVAHDAWHEGIIGIMASRLKDRFHRPVFCVAMDPSTGLGKGSGRSIPGFDLGHYVQRAKEKGLLTKGGGHAMAAGLSVSLEKVAAFQEDLAQTLHDMSVDLTPRLTFDTFLSLGSLVPSLWEDLETLAPYGQGHPQPRFCFKGLRVAKAVPVGTDHLRLILVDPMAPSHQATAMVFRCMGTPLGQHLTQTQGVPVDFLGYLQMDRWQGRETLKIIVEDARLHGS